MAKYISKEAKRRRRHLRVRRKISGTALKPRLTVNKSLKHINVQIIDDENGVTLAAFSTKDKSVVGKASANVAGGKIVGENIGKKAVAAGITQVVFDRAGYKFHGVIKAVADAAIEAGLKI